MAERQLQFSNSSKNIHSAFWDDETMGLRVVFHSGHSGVYSQVPENIVTDFEQAPSAGSYHDTYFKKTGWSYSKLS